MSSSDVLISTKPLKSRAWKYFRIKDKDSKLAKCKLCQKLLSYRTSVTNLLKHVKKCHKTALLENGSDRSENDETSIFSLSDNDYNDDDSEDGKAVKVLGSLDSKNEEESVCLLCQETFHDQNSAKMMEHMVKVHNISQIKLVDGNIHLEQEESRPDKQPKTKRSRCWDYFTMNDAREKLARCNLCNRELSFKSTVSNLIKHLKRKHNIVPPHNLDEYITDCGEKLGYEARSAVWSFFNYVNDKKTICACIQCNKEFNVEGGLKDMKIHLLEQHPEAAMHHKTNGDPLFITNDNEGNNDESEIDIQEEYLDFDDLDTQDEKRKPALGRRSSVDRKSSYERKANYERRTSFETKSSFEQKPNFERRFSLDRKPKFEHRYKRSLIYPSPVRTDNKLPVVAQSRIPDSLEHFSNYVTSLLQELPEKISKKLQMNFVKQIIEAQISCYETETSKEDTVTKISSFVDGTVADSDVSVAVNETGDESVVINESDTVEESVTVTEDVATTSADTVVSDVAVTISNGVIIRPIITTI